MFVWYSDGKRLGELNSSTLLGGRKAIVFGSLERDRRLSRILEAVGRERVQCIFDFEEANWNMEFEGIPVLRPMPGLDAVLVSPDYDQRSVSVQAQILGYEKLYFFVPRKNMELVEQYDAAFAPFFQYNVIPADRTFKYVHLMQDNKFFIPVAEMIEYGLDPSEHFFLIYDMSRNLVNAHYGSWEKYQEWMQRYQNIYLLQNTHPFYPSNWGGNRENFDKLLAYADKMIFHGGIDILGMRGYFRTKLDVIKRKGVCIPWSGPSDYDPDRERFIREIIQYVRAIVYDDKGCREFYETCFPVLRDAIWIKNLVSYARITKNPIHKRPGNKRNILISHSAYPITNAVETLEYLQDLDESFQIYAIASYGPEVEASRIVELGTKRFGNRFTAIKGYMEYDQYVEFLAQMDVAIFGMDKFLGRDTMELLFWTGAKVYLKPKSIAWNVMESVGYRLADYYSVKRLTVEELLDNPHEEWNRRLADEREFDVDKKVQQWKELFEYDWGNQV